MNIDQLIDSLRNNLFLKENSRMLVIHGDPYIEELRELYPTARIEAAPVMSRDYDCIIMFDLNGDNIDLGVIRNLERNGGRLAVVTANHGIKDIFSPSEFILSRKTDRAMFTKFRLQPSFREPMGKPSLKPARILPVSRWYSPFAVFIYRADKADRLAFYRSRTTLFARFSRVYERTLYKVRNHKVNDYIHDVSVFIKSITPYGYRFFYKDKVPKNIFPESNKINVAVVTGQLAAGGVERVLLQILSRLPNNKFNVCVFSTDFNSNSWKDKFRALATVVDIPWVLSRSKLQRFTVPFLVDSISSTPFDVILITNSEAGYRSLPKIKKRYHQQNQQLKAYDLLHTHGRHEEKDAYLRISKPFDKFIDKRVVISEYLKDYFCKYYPVSPEKVTVIRNGIGSPIKAIPKHGEKILGISGEQKAITYLGRLQSDKSPHRLVELAYLIKTELDKSNCFIAVVGDGNLRTNLENRAEELGILGKQIRFFGYQEDARSIASASVGTILTSDLEGVPLSALESLSVGTPVIAPAVGGIPEIIDDLKCGYLVDFNSAQSEDEKIIRLADAVKKLLLLNKNERATMSKAGISKIEREYTDTEKGYISLFSKP